MKKSPLVIFGGTFDPIHCGHLQIAAKVHRHCELPTITLMPCHQSPLKDYPQTSTSDRLKMIKLAIASRPYLQVDDYELHRSSPSYAIHTLQYFHSTGSYQPILLMGMDALNKFTSWYKWREILKIAALIVVNRPGQSPTEQALKLIKIREVKPPHQLEAGAIYVLSMEPISISSTEIRELIKTGKDFTHLVPKKVAQYINDKGLYMT